MKPILTILLCIGALMTNRSARSDDTASRSSNIYTIGEYGLIEKFDNRFELIKSVHLSDFVRDRHINDAALSPDGNRLLLATTAEMTLMVVETSQLSVLPDIVLQMPRASSGKPERPDPRFVISLVAEEFLYGDFVYSDPLIVNVATGTTMMAPGLKVYNKDAGVVSADGSLIISEFRGMISVYDTRNCKVVYSTRIYPEDDYGWCVKFDVDWKTSELDSLWQMGAPPAGEPVKIHINWESQTIARTNATMPPAVARILTIPGGK
ncbi:MAG: hypothetical protein NTZ09_11670, partial [Candidatus Hydrogenedentes bacterium]|nr:hypothetical protein [Candidatus Hydrogenedentota bacterium]